MSAIRESSLSALRTAGLDAHPAARHAGPCRAPYLTVHEGEVQRLPGGLEKRELIVTGYVPAGDADALDDLLTAARTALAGVASIRPLGGVSGETVLDEYRALSRELRYAALCGGSEGGR